MEKDYEIIQNISLAEKKEQVAPEAAEAPVVTVTPPGEEVAASPVIETPAIVVPEVTVQPPAEEAAAIAVPEVKLEVPGISIPTEPEVPAVEEPSVTVEEPVVVQPTYEEPTTQVEETTPEYNYGNNTSNDEYTSMFNNIDVDVTPYNNYDEYKSSYSYNTTYANAMPSDMNIDYKDEESINRYYNQKTQNVINEIEKERAAALDQSKRYKEMASWVNDIGSSFNFFKGRSGY